MCSTLSMGPCLLPCHKETSLGSRLSSAHSASLSTLPPLSLLSHPTVACLAYSHSCPLHGQPAHKHTACKCSPLHPLCTLGKLSVHIQVCTSTTPLTQMHPNSPQQTHRVWGAPPSQLKSSCPVQQLEEAPRAPPAPWGLEVSSQQGRWGRGRFPRHLSQASGRTGLKAKPISCTSNSAPHPIPVFLETGQPTTPPLGSHLTVTLHPAQKQSHKEDRQLNPCFRSGRNVTINKKEDSRHD